MDGPFQEDAFKTEPAPDEPVKGVSFLHPGEDAHSGPTLDPAQESLAGALNLMFRFVQVVMVLLVGAFLLSGVKTIGESERGIKLIFGEVVSSNVEPGIRWNWPYPLGEIVTVRTSQERVELGDVFMPQLSQHWRSRAWSEIQQPKPRLEPGVDGSLVTADGSIVHLECSVTFHRAEPVANAQHVYSADEAAMVRMAVQRGVVSAVAEMTIDQLLRQAGSEMGDLGTLGARVRRTAQQTLDAMESGVQIDSVNIRDPRPPLAVFKEFDAVATAEAQAAKSREDADRASRLVLTGVAGEAHSIILDRIDAYERALELGNEDEGDLILQQINALLEGSEVEIDGQTFAGLTSGEVTRILNDARQYRTDVVATARSRADTFEAKLAQYRRDPAVLVAADWTSAFRAFLENGQYETILLPGGAAGDFVLGPDPDIAKQIEAERNRRQADETIQSRIDFLQQRFQERMEQERRERRQGNAAGN